MRTTVARAARRPAWARAAACARIWEVSCQCFTAVPRAQDCSAVASLERDGVPCSCYPIVRRDRTQALLFPGFSWGPLVEPPKLVLSSFEAPALCRWQGLARSIDVEREHRHCGAVGIRLSASAAIRRALERSGDASGVGSSEDTRIEIESVATFGHALRPALLRHQPCSHEMLVCPSNGPRISCGDL